MRNSEAVILEMSERTRGKKTSDCGAGICFSYTFNEYASDNCPAENTKYSNCKGAEQLRNTRKLTEIK